MLSGIRCLTTGLPQDHLQSRVRRWRPPTRCCYQSLPKVEASNRHWSPSNALAHSQAVLGEHKELSVREAVQGPDQLGQLEVHFNYGLGSRQSSPAQHDPFPVGWELSSWDPHMHRVPSAVSLVGRFFQNTVDGTLKTMMWKAGLGSGISVSGLSQGGRQLVQLS